MESGLVSVRKQGEGDKGIMKIEEFAAFIHDEVKRQLEAIENN
jgi:threonyl-tRNA synthetase